MTAPAVARWARTKALFALCVESPVDARAAILARECGDDDALRAEVESLLAAHEPDASFLELSVVAAAAAPLAEEAMTRVGRRVGAWRLVREIGRGGMGAVYLAEREEGAFRQRAALKLIKRGMDTDAIVRRFRHERQILARLEHPHVARVLDGGTTADGLPYFVMEYIDGRPIDAYCAERALTTAERLTLFGVVCGAVQYAHQQLVIHRDIKPSNILVTADGVPKLLDFGLAKLLTPEDEPASTAASTALRAMTPEYASPEQVRGESVSTQTDVYSLGVLLYELLTGRRPHRFASRSPDVVARVVCEQEPERPSAAVPRLAADLDTVVAMAMRKEPERRYASAGQLAEDVARFLDGRPVVARVDTLGYRVATFVRRNRVGVLASALVLLSLVGGLAATAWQARVARAERARAEQRFADVRRLANALLFEVHDLIEPLPGATAAREVVVRRALEYLDRLSATATPRDASLQRELGAAYDRVGRIQGNSYYTNLGNTAGAAQSYAKALAIRARLAAARPGDVAIQSELADTRQGVGDVQYAVNDLRGALASYEAALAIRERLAAAYPTDDSLRTQLAETHTRVGDVAGMEGYPNLGDVPRALRHYRRAVDAHEALVASHPNDPSQLAELGATLANSGMLARVAGDPRQGIALGRRAIPMLEAATRAAPDNAGYRFKLLSALSALRYSLVDEGLLTEAIANGRRAVPILEQLAAVDPNDASARRGLSVTLNGLGRDLLRAGAVSDARAAFARSLGLAQALAAADTASAEARRDLVFTLQLLGEAHHAAGDDRTALAHYRRALALQDGHALGDRDQDDLAVTHGDIGVALAGTGDATGGVASLTRAVALAESLVVRAPTHAPSRMRLATRLFELAETHAQRAASAGDVARRAADRRAAADAYARSLALWRALRAEGRIPRVDAGWPDSVARALDRARGALTDGVSSLP